MAKWIKAILSDRDCRSELFFDADTIRYVYIHDGRYYAVCNDDGDYEREILKEDYDDILGRPNYEHEKERAGTIRMYKKIRNVLDEFDTKHYFTKNEVLEILRKAYKEVSGELENVQEQQKRNV